MIKLQIKTEDDSNFEVEIIELLDDFFAITKSPNGEYSLTHLRTTFRVTAYPLSLAALRDLHERLAHLDWNFDAINPKPACFPMAIKITRKLLNEVDGEEL